MPLWDSVQRSLEKASQEAARMAKTQRLRSIIDGLTRQIYTQNNTLLTKTMDLFMAGQLTQSELLPICQELANLQQQLNQAQGELKQIQAIQAQAAASQAETGVPNPYLPSGSPTTYQPEAGELAPTVYAPPPPEYQSYLDTTQGLTLAPPPPGMEPVTISAMETLQMSAGAAQEHASPAETRHCLACHAELPPNNAFCHNCGAPVSDANSPHLPTVRAGSQEPIYPHGQETVRAEKDEGV